ncbi:MAG: hypothetical protein NT027_12575 [Proteobacteria bacterium]|nr:hypothetical protein [Pseudomonadota bacterium]
MFDSLSTNTDVMQKYERHTPEKPTYYQAIARSWSWVVRDFYSSDKKISRHVRIKAVYRILIFFEVFVSSHLPATGV